MTSIQVPIVSIVSRCPVTYIAEVPEWSTRVPLAERPRAKDQLYNTVFGDTLMRLAHRFYEDVRLWWVLYDANASKILGHPMDLEPGLTLTIPDTEVIQQEMADDRSF